MNQPFPGTVRIQFAWRPSGGYRHAFHGRHAGEATAHVSLAALMPGDEVERTRLASERTQLAWWRTGLAAIIVIAA